MTPVGGLFFGSGPDIASRTGKLFREGIASWVVVGAHAEWLNLSPALCRTAPRNSMRLHRINENTQARDTTHLL
jgi:hypothetical protein